MAAEVSCQIKKNCSIKPKPLVLIIKFHEHTNQPEALKAKQTKEKSNNCLKIKLYHKNCKKIPNGTCTLAVANHSNIDDIPCLHDPNPILLVMCGLPAMRCRLMRPRNAAISWTVIR